MDKSLEGSILTVCRAFQKHDVSYITIGGTAVGLSGYFRVSINTWNEVTEKPDIDIWFKPTNPNYIRLLDAIEELGKDMTEYRKEQPSRPRQSFFKLDFEDFSLDLLPEIKSPLNFSDAYKRKESFKLKDTVIYFLSYEDLIADKKATARDKDLKDIEELKKIRGEK